MEKENRTQIRDLRHTDGQSFHLRVLVHMILELHGRPVFSAQLNCSDIAQAKSQLKLLKTEVKELREQYIKYHGNISNPTSNDIPDFEVSGSNTFEKLQDVCVKNMLLFSYILIVEQHHSELWKEPVLKSYLTLVKDRLSHHNSTIQAILTKLSLQIPLPSTPAPPNVSTDHAFAKKKYGWHVIVRLSDWLKQEAHVYSDICDKKLSKLKL